MLYFQAEVVLSYSPFFKNLFTIKRITNSTSFEMKLFVFFANYLNLLKQIKW